MKLSLLASLSLISAVSAASALTILSPTDQIIGGQLNGASFDVGVAGTVAGINNWPTFEPPSDLINGVIGGGGEKYLNFAELNTGVIITPDFGASIVRSIEFWVANDAARDPSAYELYGTNVTIDGVSSSYSLSDFSLISAGALALPDTRDTTADALGNSQVVGFANSTAYTSYMLIFPTVKDAASANSMQISEVQFDTTPVPEASTLALTAGLSALVLTITLRRRRS